MSLPTCSRWILTPPPDGRVLTASNSPSDVKIQRPKYWFIKILTFSIDGVSSEFHRRKFCHQRKHSRSDPKTDLRAGDGAVTGQEVQFNFSINPDTLPADHTSLCRKPS